MILGAALLYRNLLVNRTVEDQTTKLQSGAANQKCKTYELGVFFPSGLDFPGAPSCGPEGIREAGIADSE
jgi:hypothetical protein